MSFIPVTFTTSRLTCGRSSVGKSISQPEEGANGGKQRKKNRRARNAPKFFWIKGSLSAGTSWSLPGNSGNLKQTSVTSVLLRVFRCFSSLAGKHLEHEQSPDELAIVGDSTLVILNQLADVAWIEQTLSP